MEATKKMKVGGIGVTKTLEDSIISGRIKTTTVEPLFCCLIDVNENCASALIDRNMIAI